MQVGKTALQLSSLKKNQRRSELSRMPDAAPVLFMSVPGQDGQYGISSKGCLLLPQYAAQHHADSRRSVSSAETCPHRCRTTVRPASARAAGNPETAASQRAFPTGTPHRPSVPKKDKARRDRTTPSPLACGSSLAAALSPATHDVFRIRSSRSAEVPHRSNMPHRFSPLPRAHFRTSFSFPSHVAPGTDRA